MISTVIIVAVRMTTRLVLRSPAALPTWKEIFLRGIFPENDKVLCRIF